MDIEHCRAQAISILTSEEKVILRKQAREALGNGATLHHGAMIDWKNDGVEVVAMGLVHVREYSEHEYQKFPYAIFPLHIFLNVA